jgi:hypothetical protein
MRRAASKNPSSVRGPHGQTTGWDVDLKSISVAEENLFYNYDETIPASVEFLLSNRNTLTLYFSRAQSCVLVVDAQGREIFNTKSFKQHFDCPIGFVPILGPVEHHEPLYQAEAARLALFNYRAARNFRNIWFHYPTDFKEFRTALQQTWPGMDILPPEIDRSHEKPLLFMFCPEQRIPRELFWAGFGFQVPNAHASDSVKERVGISDRRPGYIRSLGPANYLGYYVISARIFSLPHISPKSSLKLRQMILS